jgi:surfactin synthase thioesterase subunit
MRTRCGGEIAAVAGLLGVVSSMACSESEPPPSQVADVALAEASGLTAEYFRGTALDPNDRWLSRIDPAVDFRWGFGPPFPEISPDGFSARWTGWLRADSTQLHTFYVRGDDAVRVWIDDRLIVDHRAWWTESQVSYPLTAGALHPIRVEYAEAWGWAEVSLSWSRPNRPRETIPAGNFVPAPRPPGQAAVGPGGADYPHASCRETQHTIWWNNDLTFWTFEPAAPTPRSATLVVFNHGWMGNHPDFYRRWLQHLCRRGNVVVFPRYQDLFTLPDFFTPNAVWSLREALARLSRPGNVRPETERGMMILGHSAGGTVSVNLAHRWSAEMLPEPRAVFAVQPAAPTVLSYDSLQGIPPRAMLSCLVGDEDDVVGRTGCDAIFERIAHLRARTYVTVRSDRLGAPPLIADHFQPSEGTVYIDALDYRGTWKLADGLRDCALLGSSCATVTPGPEMVDMGAWSDGTPVNPLEVTGSE